MNTAARRPFLRRSGSVAALLMVLALPACDSGPRGPGTLTTRVTAPQPVGAVVLEVVGAGITGFEGQGAVRVFGALDSGGSGKHRVVVLSPTGGTEIRFGITFADRSGTMPTITAVSAATPANASVSTAGIRVRVER